MARVLIIGPSGVFNATLAKLLARAGHAVEAAGVAPVDAWLVDGHPPDLLIVDAMWPHADDRCYALALEAEPALGKLPRIFLTTDSTRKPRVTTDGLRWPPATARKMLDVEAYLLLLAHAACTSRASTIADSERPLA